MTDPARRLLRAQDLLDAEPTLAARVEAAQQARPQEPAASLPASLSLRVEAALQPSRPTPRTLDLPAASTRR